METTIARLWPRREALALEYQLAPTDADSNEAFEPFYEIEEAILDCHATCMWDLQRQAEIVNGYNLMKNQPGTYEAGRVFKLLQSIRAWYEREADRGSTSQLNGATEHGASRSD